MLTKHVQYEDFLVDDNDDMERKMSQSEEEFESWRPIVALCKYYRLTILDFTIVIYSETGQSLVVPTLLLARVAS